MYCTLVISLAKRDNPPGQTRRVEKWTALVESYVKKERERDGEP